MNEPSVECALLEPELEPNFAAPCSPVLAKERTLAPLYRDALRMAKLGSRRTCKQTLKMDELAPRIASLLKLVGKHKPRPIVVGRLHDHLKERPRRDHGT